jgi:hypothetical protein
VQQLKAEQRALASPKYIEQQARDKLHMCFPDQTCYVVIQPTAKAPAARTDTQSTTTPWYGRLWTSVREADRPAAR